MYDFDTIDKKLLVFGYLFRVANRLQSKMDSQMNDLTAKQWYVIMALGLFEEPPTLKQLAAACDTSHQNIKQIVLKLQKKGFVINYSDEKDGRAMRITASEKCEQWDKENEQNAAQFINSMFSGMSANDIAQLSGSLIKLFENLNKINGGTNNV